jgi:hypothetical protein
MFILWLIPKRRVPFLEADSRSAVKIFPRLSSAITALTRTHYGTPLRAKEIQSTRSHSICSRSILILSSCQLLGQRKHNAVYSYSRDVRFEYRPRHPLCWLRVSRFSSVLHASAGIVRQLGHDCVLANPFQFIYLPELHSLDNESVVI